MMPNQPGTLYWLTGLPGAGKTTIGRELLRKLQLRKPNVVMLDGDALREIMGFTTTAYAPADRLKLAMQYSRLCQHLVEQGIDVVCATVSMFHEVRSHNRNSFDSYFEVYVRVPMDVLVARDTKALYSRALKEEIPHVPGVNLDYEEPENPDLIIDNNGSQPPCDLADVIQEESRKAISLNQ